MIDILRSYSRKTVNINTIDNKQFLQTLLYVAYKIAQRNVKGIFLFFFDPQTSSSSFQQVVFTVYYFLIIISVFRKSTYSMVEEISIT